MTKAIGLFTLAGVVSLSAADIIASYGFTDLNGAYNAATGQFTANAVANAPLSTGGDVTSLIGAGGTAGFATGFFGVGPGDIVISMDISNVTATSADAVGTVVITDLDGDTLTASYTGTWNILAPFGFMFFDGVSADYDFSDNGDLDGLFNGTSGSFSLASFPALYDGAISLLLRNPGGFSTSFSSVSTQADGIMIPGPGPIVMAGLGFVVIAGRRRG